MECLCNKAFQQVFAVKVRAVSWQMQDADSHQSQLHLAKCEGRHTNLVILHTSSRTTLINPKQPVDFSDNGHLHKTLPPQV